MTQRDSIDDVVFRSEAVALGDLTVTRMRGVEALSQPFEFVLRVESRHDVGIELEQMESLVQLPAYIAFGPDEETPIHGVIRRVEMLPSATPGRVQYDLTLVPRLWHLNLTSGTWVYQDLNTAEIIKDVLQAAELREGDDFEFRLTAKYPPREYTVQYQESDLAFISRLMEHDGMYYFFAHDGGREKLIITDSNVAFGALEGHEAISFDPRAGVTDGQQVITAVGRTRQIGSRSVTMKDYNWRTPSTKIAAGYVFDPHGHGLQVEYGAHVKDVASAKRLAKVRAEEFFCQRERFQFTGHVRGLRAGHRFSLTNHFMPDLWIDYVVVSVEHSAAQAAPGDDAGGSERYTNRFEAIRADVQFRAERKTPRPRIAGFIHAKTDGPNGQVGSDGGTPIDAEGRYKVSLPMDQHRTGANRSSRWIRRAQPASGDGFGMHFPLHVGTEVMLLHLDGDPDRPVIVGTVPNPENASPVTSADPTTSRIKTRSGVVMGWNDKRG